MQRLWKYKFFSVLSVLLSGWFIKIVLYTEYCTVIKLMLAFQSADTHGSGGGGWFKALFFREDNLYYPLL